MTMNIAAQLQALFSINGLITLIILAALELVLGIDNIIFISLVIARLPRATGLLPVLLVCRWLC